MALAACGGQRKRARAGPVVVDDQADGLEELPGVLGVGVLHLLGLGRLLGFVENRLRHSVRRRARTAGSSGQNRQPLAQLPAALPAPAPVTLASRLSTEGEDPDSNPEAA